MNFRYKLTYVKITFYQLTPENWPQFKLWHIFFNQDNWYIWLDSSHWILLFTFRSSGIRDIKNRSCVISTLRRSVQELKLHSGSYKILFEMKIELDPRHTFLFLSYPLEGFSIKKYYFFGYEFKNFCWLFLERMRR